MKFKIVVPESFASRFSAAFDLNTAVFQVLVTLTAAGGCYFLYARGVHIPTWLSLLHGPSGVAVGVVGVFLALTTATSTRTCLVIGWLCLWFTAGLAELRASAVTDGIVLGGMIPYSDANNFLREASRLIQGQDMTPWASRPLSDTYLAGNLYIAHDQVTLALVLAGVLNAAAIGLAALELRKCMGLIAATLWTWLLLVYCRRYLGEMLSEQAGVAYGALGVALLLRAFAANALRCLWPGLFILSLALNARAGALLVLPVLVAAVAWHWRRSGRVRVLALATVSVAAAFLMSFLFLKVVGARGGRLMSNYHDVIYGVVFGGNWQQAAINIPNYRQMDASTRAAEINRRVIAAVKADPSLIWRGTERNWSDFFTRSNYALGPFSFFRHPRTEFALLTLSGIGLLSSVLIGHRLSPLILVAGVGIVFSVPFVPTRDADLMRAYAATMPLMFLIPAFSFVGFRNWIACLGPNTSSSSPRLSPATHDSGGDSLDLYYSTVPYLAVMLLVPLFARFVVPIRPTATLRDDGPDVELTLDLNRATWIELTSSNDPRARSPQRISAKDFKQGIFGSFRYLYPKQTEFLESISRPGIVLVCPGSTDAAFLVIDAKHLSDKSRKAVVWGRAHSADENYDPSFLENSSGNPSIAKQNTP